MGTYGSSGSKSRANNACLLFAGRHTNRGAGIVRIVASQRCIHPRKHETRVARVHAHRQAVGLLTGMFIHLHPGALDYYVLL